MTEIKLMPPHEFQQIQGAGNICVVDVRNRDEYQAGSAASVCWPVSEINGASAAEFVRQQQLAPDRTVVLLCASGKRAQMAAEKLHQLLPNPIAVLQGGQSALHVPTGH